MSNDAVVVDFIHKVVEVEFDKDITMAATQLIRAAAEAAESAERAENWAEGTDAQVEELGGEHSSKGWATISGSSANAAHDSEVAAKASEDAAAQSAAEAAGINYLVRKNSTYYEAGVVAFYQTIPSPLVLECTTAGTTASTAPDFSGATEGDTVTDGTVEWTYKNLLSGESGGGVAVGFIMPYAGTGLQEGWLDCDGSAVSRTMYSDLFAAIGTTWGAGDGSTTFNLPRSEDLVLQGASATNPVGTYKSAGLPNITGGDDSTTPSDYSFLGKRNTAGQVSSGAITVTNLDDNANWPGGSRFLNNIYIDASKSNSIYGNSDTVQPPAACVRFLIKY